MLCTFIIFLVLFDYTSLQKVKDQNATKLQPFEGEIVPKTFKKIILRNSSIEKFLVSFFILREYMK